VIAHVVTIARVDRQAGGPPDRPPRIPAVARRSFTMFAIGKIVRVAAVVVLAASLTFVVLGSMAHGRKIWDQAGDLPDYLAQTFLHLDGPIRQYVLHGLALDLQLIVGGLVLGVGIGVATGTVCGPRPHTALDGLLAVGSAAALSVPVFWFGLVLLFVFSPLSGSMPIGFFSSANTYAPLTADPLAWLHAIWVPWLVLATPVAAVCHRVTRSSLRDVLDEDYVRAARATGVSERRLLWRHALPAALPAVIGLVSVTIPVLVANAVLIEPLFSLPGALAQADVGQLMGGYDGVAFSTTSTHTPPFEVAQALIVEGAFLVAVMVLVCDLLHARLDPRVRE
jgi:peptide/nickel transport system permease protein